MSEGKPIPVRLNDALLARLDAAAERCGITSRSGLIKFCLQTFIDHLDRTGEEMSPDWSRIISDMDGRRHRYGRPQVHVTTVNHSGHNLITTGGVLKVAEAGPVYGAKRKRRSKK